jgi:hypothetical protein
MESTAQNLGRAGPAPRVGIIAPTVLTESMIPNDTPLLYTTAGATGVGGTFVIGLTETADGLLTYHQQAAPFVTNASSLCVNTQRRFANNVVNLGVAGTVHSTDLRELRALPVPVIAPAVVPSASFAATAMYPRAASDFLPTGVFTPGTSEFWLAWRPPGTTDGYPVTIMHLYGSKCLVEPRASEALGVHSTAAFCRRR